MKQILILPFLIVAFYIMLSAQDTPPVIEKIDSKINNLSTRLVKASDKLDRANALLSVTDSADNKETAPKTKEGKRPVRVVYRQLPPVIVHDTIVIVKHDTVRIFIESPVYKDTIKRDYRFNNNQQKGLIDRWFKKEK